MSATMVLSMDDRPLEILPYGRTLETQERLDRKKARGKRGARILGYMALIIVYWLAYLAGWMQGRH